jgi:hypothetical protein
MAGQPPSKPFPSNPYSHNNPAIGNITTLPVREPVESHDSIVSYLYKMRDKADRKDFNFQKKPVPVH